MKVEINKDIRTYAESVVLGLSLRQVIICSFGILVSIGVFFILWEGLLGSLPLELASWLCVFASAPIMAFALLTFNGQPLERIVLAFLKHHFWDDKILLFQPENYYAKLLGVGNKPKKKKETRKQDV